MYSDTHTTNPLRGECIHKCDYCYVERMKQKFPGMAKKYSGKPILDKGVIKGKTDRELTGDVFVCSCTDLFAENVCGQVIGNILRAIQDDEERGPRGFRWAFQTKNPRRMVNYLTATPEDSLLIITLETNRGEEVMEKFSQAPDFESRVQGAMVIAEHRGPRKLRITVEPIMALDPIAFGNILRHIGPNEVAIGADSSRICAECSHPYDYRGRPKCPKCGCRWSISGHHHPEPNDEAIRTLIRVLDESGIQVILKENIVALGDFEPGYY